MIIHICGASGSGKSYLGNTLKEKLKKQSVLITDMDALWESFLKLKLYKTTNQIEIEYQKYINQYISKQIKKYDNLIFVGLNSFVIGEQHWFEDNTHINLPKYYFDLQSDVNYYIDADKELIIKQMYDRGYNIHINWFHDWMINRKEIVYNNLIKNEKQTKKDLSVALLRFFDFSDIKKNIEKWNKYYKHITNKKGISYIFLSQNKILEKCIKLIIS